ncbi:MAG: maltotransferase domain-containing protein, partial [Verrucomicrobiota bacterium]
MMNGYQRPATVVIANPSPLIEGGRYPAKRVVGERLSVEADIFKDGHDVIRAEVSSRLVGAPAWTTTPLAHINNDRWGAEFHFGETGQYELVIRAWSDDAGTWIHDFERRLTGDQSDFATEIEEGRVIFNQMAIRAASARAPEDAEAIEQLTTRLMKTAPSDVPALMNEPAHLELISRWPDRSLATEIAEPLSLVVETKRSNFSAWYEFFPRSASGAMERHSTFRDCLPRLDDAAAMGFDIVYFPPIHPIGISHRKGKNNTLTASADDVG